MANSPTESLKYPIQRFDSTYDWLDIKIVKYLPPGIGRGFGTSTPLAQQNGSDRLQRNQTILANIGLPIPNNLADRNVVKWGASSLNSLSATAFGAATAAIETSEPGMLSNLVGLFQQQKEQNDSSPSKNVRSPLTELTSKLKTAISKNRDIIRDYAIASGINVFNANVSPADVISRTQGVVLNPNLELLFNGVELRAFSFNFTMNPRSSEEARAIKRIINVFKRRMAAKSRPESFNTPASQGLFIGAPDIFLLKFQQGTNLHPFLFLMKPCALRNVTVNYTAGSNRFISYEDGTPAQIALGLQFQELDPVYAEDYSPESLEEQGFSSTYEGVGF